MTESAPRTGPILLPSLQRLDPIGIGGLARLVSNVFAVIAPLASVLSTVASPAAIANWPFEIAAFAAIALSGAMAVLGTSPFRAPLAARTGRVVVGLAVLAFALDSLARVGRPVMDHQGWGVYIVAPTFIVLAIKRPALEVLVTGLAATVAVGAVSAATVASAPPPVNAFGCATIAMTYSAPAAVAAAVIAQVAYRMLREAPADAPTTRTSVDPTRIVREESITRLEADVVPLLSSIVADGALTAEQSVAARRIATELRAALVADLSRDWLGELGLTVDDPSGYGARMTPEQRAAVRGLVSAVPADRAAGTATIVGQDRTAILELGLDVPGRTARSLLAPHLLLLRAAFPRVAYRAAEDRVTVTIDFALRDDRAGSRRSA